MIKPIFAAIGILWGASSVAFADVDTLECNTARAIRVKVGGLHEFCLLRGGDAQIFKIDGRTVSLSFEGRCRGDDEIIPALGAASAGQLVLTLDDLPGRIFIVQPLVIAPYNPDTDSNWRFTPMWMQVGDPIRIDVGAPERRLKV